MAEHDAEGSGQSQCEAGERVEGAGRAQEDDDCGREADEKAWC